jgi:hypothetical protein
MFPFSSFKAFDNLIVLNGWSYPRDSDGRLGSGTRVRRASGGGGVGRGWRRGRAAQTGGTETDTDSQPSPHPVQAMPGCKVLRR